MVNHNKYINRVGGVTSRFFNVILLNGHPAESISGRSYRMLNERPNSVGRQRLVKFINTLFFLEENHCKHAYEEDISYAYYRIERHKNLFSTRP